MTDPVDLSRFCSTDRQRQNLHAPFSRAGYTWATNGQIMARVPIRSDVPAVDDAPHAERVWTNAKGEFKPVQPFSLPKPKRSRCTGCDGRGTEHECPECTCACEECNGSGHVEEDAYVSAGEGVTINRRYAEIMLALPGLQVEVADPSAERMHFRFDGGEGVVMPLRPGYRRAIIADLFKGAPA